MSRRWIRLDAEWDESEWLDALDGHAANCWPRLLTWAKLRCVRGRVRTPSLAVLARKWRVDVDCLERLIAAAIEDGAIVVDEREWLFANWVEYQETDPTAAERKRRQRQREANPQPVTDVTRDTSDGRCDLSRATETLTVTPSTTDTVSNETGTDVPPSYPHPASTELTAGDLMGLCRKRLYVGGRPPSGRTEGQDMNTIQTMLKRGIRPAAISDMIEAAAQMRDDGQCGFADRTTSLSMGALYFKPKQSGDWTPRPFVNEALEYWRRKQSGTRDRPSKLPPKVGDVLRLAIGG